MSDELDRPDPHAPTPDVAATPKPDPTPDPTPGPTPGAPDPTPGHRPSGSITQPPPTYKGEPLDGERGPGLGCFWTQVVLLGTLLVLTPLTVAWAWDPAISAGLLIVTLILLLFAGNTVIFLLRLVAADRRGRRQPLAPRSPTVGQLEDEPSRSAGATGPPVEADAGPSAPQEAPAGPEEPPSAPASSLPDEPGPPSAGPVRQ